MLAMRHMIPLMAGNAALEPSSPRFGAGAVTPARVLCLNAYSASGAPWRALPIVTQCIGTPSQVAAMRRHQGHVDVTS